MWMEPQWSPGARPDEVARVTDRIDRDPRHVGLA
jgi:hypothetical protein